MIMLIYADEQYISALLEDCTRVKALPWELREMKAVLLQLNLACMSPNSRELLQFQQDKPSYVKLNAEKDCPPFGRPGS